MARFSSCNIVDLHGDTRRYWRFNSGGSGGVTLAGDRTGVLQGAVPSRHAGKSWTALWNPRLNIAWLPLNAVFLRVVQLPRCAFSELESMVEFQLEKISPLPVNQIVWSLEPVPTKGTTPSETQSVLVVIASRDAVEELIGALETVSYQPDQLEVPFLHQLLTTEVRDNGIWLHPFAEGEQTFCLVAWWYDGKLQNLNLIHLTTPECWNAEIEEEVRKAAWAGELEGWLTGPPRFHLVSSGAEADAWVPVLAPLSERPVDVVQPMEPVALATLAARRAAKEESKTNLLPEEYAVRYRQQFVDRLWMRGLGATLMLYLVAIIVYFGWLEYLRYQKSGVEDQVAKLEADYKKTQELRERIAVRESQVNFRYAALDCLLAVSDLLPSQVVLDRFSFTEGRITLQGTAPNGSIQRLNNFSESLAKYQHGGRQMFRLVEKLNFIQSPQGGLSWTLYCELGTGTDS